MPEPQATGVPDGWQIITPSAPPPSTGTWEDRGIAGKVWHPASGATEGHRVDNSVLGVPPELAVTGGIGAVRSIAGAIAGSAPSVASRVAAGTKAAIAQAAPTLKYEATKTALEKMGVPTAMAVPIAMAVSGYKPGAKAAPAEAIPAEAMPAAAAPVSPGAAGPVAPGPPAAPAIPAGSPPPPAATSPAPAMPAVQTMRNLSPATQAGVKLTAAETSEFLRLQKQGKSMKDAFDLIAAQRAFAQRFGLPTAGDVRNAVVDRNMSGKWPE